MWKCKYCDTYNDDADMFCSVCDKSRHYTRVLTLTKRRAEKLHLTGRIVIPEKYNVIGKGAFKSRTDITSVVIHSSVKKISKEAFYGCVNLSEVQCLGKLSSIGSLAFANCSRLLPAQRPSATRYLADDAFKIISAPPRTEAASYYTPPVSTVTHYEYATTEATPSVTPSDETSADVEAEYEEIEYLMRRRRRKRKMKKIAIGLSIGLGIATLITILAVVLL